MNQFFETLVWWFGLNLEQQIRLKNGDQCNTFLFWKTCLTQSDKDEWSSKQPQDEFILRIIPASIFKKKKKTKLKKY